MTRDDALRLVDEILGPPRHLASWATPATPKDGWRMGKGVALSPEKAEAIADAILAAVAKVEEPTTTLFDAIAHGDTVHREWLRQAIDDHFAGRPVARPVGKGAADAAVAEARAARDREWRMVAREIIEAAEADMLNPDFSEFDRDWAAAWAEGAREVLRKMSAPDREPESELTCWDPKTNPQGLSGVYLDTQRRKREDG